MLFGSYDTESDDLKSQVDDRLASTSVDLRNGIRVMSRMKVERQSLIADVSLSGYFSIDYQCIGLL